MFHAGRWRSGLRAATIAFMTIVFALSDTAGFADGAVSGADALHIDGLVHEPLGNATLEALDTDGNGAFDRLIITNIGDSGEDGARIRLGAAASAASDASAPPVQGWTGAIDFGPAGKLTPGMQLAVTPYDAAGAALPGISLRSDGVGHALATLATACADCTINLKAYVAGQPVADLDGDGFADVLAAGPMGTGGSQDDQAITAFDWKQISPATRGHHGHVTVLKLAEPTSIVITGVGEGGGTAVEADTLIVTVETADEVEPPSELAITASNTGGNNIAVVGQAILSADFALRARGVAHMFGAEVCDKDNHPGCGAAITFSNLTSTGEDGVRVRNSRTGRNPQTGKEIKIAAKMIAEDETLTAISDRCEPAAALGDPNESCGDTIASYGSWLIGADENGSLTAFADFSGINGSATDATCIEVWSSGDQVAKQCPAPATGITVAACPEQPSVRVSSIAEVAHAGGEHMPGIIWRFAEPVCIDVVQNGDPVTGDELRFTSSQPKIVENERGLTVGVQPPPGAAPGTLHILTAESASAGFIAGHVFGMPHEAFGDATLAVRDFDTIDNAPEEKERGLSVSGSGSDDGVIIDVDDAAFFIARFKVGTDLAKKVRMSAVTSAGPAPTAFIERCEGDSCPDASGVDDPAACVIDFSELNAGGHDIEVRLAHEVVHTVQQGGGAVQFYAGGASLGDAEMTIGTHEGDTLGAFRWSMPTPIKIEPGGEVILGDSVIVRPLEADSMPPIDAVAIRGSGSDADSAWETVILDEAVGLFDREHRARGVAHIDCCLDPDDDGDGIPTLGIVNPSQGQPATVASNNLRLLKFMRHHYGDDFGWRIADPCAGKPEPCDVFPNGATLESVIDIETGEPNSGGSAGLEMTTAPGGGAVHVASDFASLQPNDMTLQVLLGEEVVATLPEPDTAVEVTCSSCGSIENWPFREQWLLAAEDGVNSGPVVTLRWDGTRSFTAANASAGETIVEGDGLRLIADTNVELKWIRSSELTTVNIPAVLVTEPAGPPCPGDLNGDDLVNVDDLLIVLNNWGACPGGEPGCPGDANGSGVINVDDLLIVLNNWGACPE